MALVALKASMELPTALKAVDCRQSLAVKTALNNASIEFGTLKIVDNPEQKVSDTGTTIRRHQKALESEKLIKTKQKDRPQTASKKRIERTDTNRAARATANVTRATLGCVVWRTRRTERGSIDALGRTERRNVLGKVIILS
uniref:Transposase n=1 Tax=Panagrellus redivivus TaxID=6233 RepID=A0A7E4WAN2_PANRE